MAGIASSIRTLVAEPVPVLRTRTWNVTTWPGATRTVGPVAVIVPVAGVAGAPATGYVNVDAPVTVIA